MKKVFISFLSLFIVSVCFSQKVKSIKITDLEKIITESKVPLIVNFWATWCKPCIEEIPYFQEEIKMRSFDTTQLIQLILVSVDYKEEFPGGITATAKKRKFTMPILWLNESNADYFCPKVDPKWSGAIPASLFINNNTGYHKFIEAQLSREDVQQEIMAILSIN